MKWQRSVVLVGLCAAGVFGTVAVAQTMCSAPGGWPSGLVYFCADAPARADDVNANFRQLVTWVEAKVGPVGQPTVIPADGVTSTSILNASIVSADLAGGAVTGANLADGGVTPRTLASPRAAYTVDSHCESAGLLTTAATCRYGAPQCGTCSVASVPLPRYRDCNDVCFTCNGMPPPPPPTCTADNAFEGYLVR